MNIAFISPNNWINRVGQRLARSGHNVSDVADETTDVIIGMSISVMGDIEKAIAAAPDANLFLYSWDCYSWVWSRPREGEYDFKKWGSLCVEAKEVWCPSIATVRQSEDDFPCVNARRIMTFVPDLERFGDGPFDNKRFVLLPLRKLPDDCVGWFEQACGELGINFVTTDHKLTDAEYIAAVRTCSFVVSSYREASTGGLGLIEAAWCGKPVLINASGQNGAVDYFGPNANYFYDSYDGLKTMLDVMFTKGALFGPPSRETIASQFSLDRMTSEIEERINAIA